MCGIVGFVSPKRADNSVEKMLDVQAYRGHDTGSLWRLGSTFGRKTRTIMENIC